MEANNTETNSPVISEQVSNERQYAMFIHLSQLAGLIIPLLGWVLPLILWQTKKDTSAYINNHGKIVMNWIISSLIYSIVGIILSLIFIGIFLLIVLGICSLIFIIIGAVKANNGETWPYPLSIPFLK